MAVRLQALIVGEHCGGTSGRGLHWTWGLDKEAEEE